MKCLFVCDHPVALQLVPVSVFGHGWPLKIFRATFLRRLGRPDILQCGTQVRDVPESEKPQLARRVGSSGASLVWASEIQITQIAATAGAKRR
jgi:hypothetical protein